MIALRTSRLPFFGMSSRLMKPKPRASRVEVAPLGGAAAAKVLPADEGRRTVASLGARLVFLLAPVVLGLPEDPWAWAKVAATATTAAASDAEVEAVLAAVLLDMVSERREGFSVDLVLVEKSG